MANIVITKTAVKMVITYNSLSAKYKQKVVNINRKCISQCIVTESDNSIELTLRSNRIFIFKYSEVDSVDTNAVGTNTILADKITDLIL